MSTLDDKINEHFAGFVVRKDLVKAVKGKDPLHFECHFTNDSTDTLTFGESAFTNEMCILSARYYGDGDAESIDCNP